MDSLLIAVTALSLLMAAAMAVVVMKLLGDERRRSDARVAALTELAAADDVPRADVVTRPVRSLRVQAEDTRTADLPLRVAVARATEVHHLFDEPQRSSPWGWRLAIIATLLVVLGGTGGMMYGGSNAPDTTATQAASAAGPAPRAPLELLSLRHSQDAGRLTVTGLVQNPRGAAPLTRVVATAIAFAPDGTFLASGRAALDFTSLGGGDESPFVVTVPVTGNIARYRVGFRAEDGTVIAHVDKRSTDPATLAQK